MPSSFSFPLTEGWLMPPEALRHKNQVRWGSLWASPRGQLGLHWDKALDQVLERSLGSGVVASRCRGALPGNHCR